MLHILSMSILLAVTWWFLSGYLEVLILSLGLLSISFVIWITHRMKSFDQETHPVHLASSAIFYFPWLFWEIFKSNIDVACAIIRGGMSVQPRLMIVKAGQVSEIGRVVYANSITLTPGTVTIGAEDNIFTIHSLTPKAREGLKGGEMDKRVTHMELDTGSPTADSQPALQRNFNKNKYLGKEK